MMLKWIYYCVVGRGLDPSDLEVETSANPCEHVSGPVD
jgi:hypothetical protein